MRWIEVVKKEKIYISIEKKVRGQVQNMTFEPWTRNRPWTKSGQKMTALQELIYTDDGSVWVVITSGMSHAVHAHRCKMVNWLFTLGFPVQTNTDGSFLVVFEVVYVVRWYKYK